MQRSGRKEKQKGNDKDFEKVELYKLRMLINARVCVQDRKRIVMAEIKKEQKRKVERGINNRIHRSVQT